MIPIKENYKSESVVEKEMYKIFLDIPTRKHDLG